MKFRNPSRRMVIAGVVASVTALRAQARSADIAVPFSAGTHAPRLSVPRHACDAHHHIFDSRFPKSPSWKGGDVLDATVADYRLLQRRLGTSRSIVVQPSPYGSDNSCLVDALRRMAPNSRGIAVVNPEGPVSELRDLDRAGVRGIRINFRFPQDWGVTTQDHLIKLARRVAGFGWHVVLQMGPEQVVRYADVIRTLPVPVVFDHVAGMPLDADRNHPTFAVLHRLVEDGAWVKLTGPHRDADMMQALISSAPDRILWGSNWPHPGDAEIADDAEQIDQLLLWAVSGAQCHKILVENPNELYRFS